MPYAEYYGWFFVIIGFLALWDYFSTRYEIGMRELVIRRYAGQEAETRVGGEGSESESDERQADVFYRHGQSDEEMRAATSEFVTEHWPLIDRIARELLEHTTLDYYELDSLLNIYRGRESEDDLREYRKRKPEL